MRNLFQKITLGKSLLFLVTAFIVTFFNTSIEIIYAQADKLLAISGLYLIAVYCFSLFSVKLTLENKDLTHDFETYTKNNIQNMFITMAIVSIVLFISLGYESPTNNSLADGLFIFYAICTILYASLTIVIASRIDISLLATKSVLSGKKGPWNRKGLTTLEKEINEMKVILKLGKVPFVSADFISKELDSTFAEIQAKEDNRELRNNVLTNIRKLRKKILEGKSVSVNDFSPLSLRYAI